MRQKKPLQGIKSSQSNLLEKIPMKMEKIVVHFHSNEEVVEYLVESGAIEYDQILEVLENLNKINQPTFK